MRRKIAADENYERVGNPSGPTRRRLQITPETSGEELIELGKYWTGLVRRSIDFVHGAPLPGHSGNPIRQKVDNVEDIFNALIPVIKRIKRLEDALLYNFPEGNIEELLEAHESQYLPELQVDSFQHNDRNEDRE